MTILHRVKTLSRIQPVRLYLRTLSRGNAFSFFQQSSQIRFASAQLKMSAIEDAKRAAAREAVANHYPQNPKFVGIGSGTTIVYVVEAIKALGIDTSSTSFVPTGFQSNQLIVNAGLTPIAFDALPEGAVLDIAFDGSDEVDDDLNCIKGGGACLFQEKLVALQAKEFIVVADYRKLQPRLLTAWPSIPIEVAPLASRRVITALQALGSPEPKLRQSLISQEGPVKTDQSFFLIDAPFPQLLTSSDIQSGKTASAKEGIWEVETLAKEIKQIPGVLEVGLFYGPTGPQAQATGGVGGQKPIAAYFGMADGSVSVRKVK
ncbi:ribose 5-phosphate isomerase A [Coccidioides immitis RS]|uniref:Ribose-5-phosphate isomerase n=3 Tax=Coccidioides immitis TaxID=5501 RepID=J3K2V3_COCIM|nr:ribose 5-phosphate isomerase A [Coccidioides immitis RS]EAS28458.3 ribose 5-phosphate isomerase A [Coccidioides immitis RS]KMP02755.1 ribose-5-phosphate isomerase [Coccidioides immitis RMSCC 2394]KMU81361.1 ribose-5-phosphate isomerase [Coccidioides immitis RMSCC 3703]